MVMLCHIVLGGGRGRGAIRQGEDMNIYRYWGSSWFWFAELFSFPSSSSSSSSLHTRTLGSYSFFPFPFPSNTPWEVHDSYFFVFFLLSFFFFSLNFGMDF